MAVVAVFGSPLLQGFDLLAQLLDRLDRFLERFRDQSFLLCEPFELLVSGGQGLTHGLILLAEAFEFVIPFHTTTVADGLCFRQLPSPTE